MATPKSEVVQNLIKSNKLEEDVYKEHEFNTYVFWKSLPTFILKLSPDKLESYGFDEELVLPLLGIKTQKQFAEKFDLHETTLVQWNKRIEKDNLLNNSSRDWGKELTKNVVTSLYQKILKDGGASEIKLWLQYIEGWTEKQEIKQGISDELKQTIDKLNSIIES